MFKKVAIFAVAGALAASLAGCAQVEGGSEESAQEPQQEQKADEGSRDSDAEQASNAVEAPSSPQPYLKESGWSYSGGYVNFCAIVGNTDPVNCYVLMPLDVTAKASDGTILANETFYAQWIAPNDTMPVHGVLSNLSEEPAEVTVDFSFKEGSKPGNDYTLADMPVTNVTDTGVKVTGEYENKTGCDFQRGVTVFVVFRDNGKIVGGCEEFDYSNPCPNGKRSAFDATYQHNGIPEHDSVDVYVVPNLM